MSKRCILFAELRRNPGQMLLFVILVPAIYYSILMISLIFSFDNVPNYVNGYNWIGNTFEIFRSTPSLSDALAIISEEWLLEIGFMNYDYGFGISEWSLNIMPFKLLLVMLLAALLLLNFRLFKLARSMPSCSATKPWLRASVASTGMGSIMVGAASMTMFWVVCCASPSWVVGLAMLGLVSVSAALALDPLETYVMVTGFSLLCASTFCLLNSAQLALNDRYDWGHGEILPAKDFRRQANA